MNRNIIASLIKVANDLDVLGYNKEADTLTKLAAPKRQIFHISLGDLDGKIVLLVNKNGKETLIKGPAGKEFKDMDHAHNYAKAIRKSDPRFDPVSYGGELRRALENKGLIEKTENEDDNE
jgi:hypothetical protein